LSGTLQLDRQQQAERKCEIFMYTIVIKRKRQSWTRVTGVMEGETSWVALKLLNSD
jgi:hypothetical protein